MTKALIVLGSTGSIGRQTLAVARALNLPVKALSAGYNRDLLLEQILEFKPEMVSLAQAADARWPAGPVPIQWSLQWSVSPVWSRS